MELPNFEIQNKGDISELFLERKVKDFHEAANFIKNLKYGRNSSKEDLKIIFEENKGTCSTKHAVLKKLADESGFEEIKLVLGIFKMNAKNTPKIAETLSKNNLEYIPEAHNYLKFKNEIFDFTFPNSQSFTFAEDLMWETTIIPDEINLKKLEIHQEFLKSWLKETPEIKINFEDLWKIREQCIQDLSN